MPAKVVDASALAALIFGEPDADKVSELIEGATLVAPALLPFELANACVKKIRRHPDDRETLIRALGYWTRLNVAILPVDIAAVVELANESTLTAYDASYLWLAESFSYELVTLDRRLSAAYRVSPSTP